MNIIVFSKDRAAQLDLFLRSFYKYVKNANNYEIKILYTFSNNDFKKGYDLILNKYNKVIFVLERDFKKDLLNLILSLNHTVFFVDDDVFIRDFDFYDSQQNIFEKNINILCRSLRLNYYLEWSYAARSHINSVPVFDNNGIFYWKSCDGDYSYPMSLDGHIFRTKQIYPLLETLNYRNPNSLEGILSQNPINLPKMMCYPDSKIINIPVNRVQDNNYNYCGKITAESLNNRFLNGEKLNLNYNNLRNNAVHMELEYSYDVDY